MCPLQTLASKGSVGILPSSRELSLPSVESSASGSGLQIALDLEDVAEDDGDDEEWEDVDHLKTSGSQEQDKVSHPGHECPRLLMPSWRSDMVKSQKSPYIIKLLLNPITSTILSKKG